MTIGSLTKPTDPENRYADMYRLNLKSMWREFRGQSWSFILFSFYLFVEYVRPQSIYAFLDNVPLAQITLIGTLVTLSASDLGNRAINGNNKLLSVFAVIVLFSSVFAYVPEKAFDELPLFLTWCLVYFLFTTIVNSEPRFFLLLFVYVLCNFKMTQHGFLNWASIGFSWREWGVSGAPGWFRNSGEFGIQLSIFLPLAVCIAVGLWKKWGKVQKLFFGLIILTGFGSVIATSSRGAMLGTAAAFIWLAMVSKARFKVMTVLAVVGAMVFAFTPEESLERFRSSGEDTTSMQRIEVWKDGIETMNKYPLFGVGYRNWSTYEPENFTDTLRGTRLLHNVFIEAGAELGYSGLLVFLLMIIFVFITNNRTRNICRSTGNNAFLMAAYGLDAGLVGFMVSGSFVTVLFYPYFWIQMAFSVALWNSAKRSSDHSTHRTS